MNRLLRWEEQGCQLAGFSGESDVAFAAEQQDHCWKWRCLSVGVNYNGVACSEAEAIHMAEMTWRAVLKAHGLESKHPRVGREIT